MYEVYYFLMSEGLTCTPVNTILGYTEGYLYCSVCSKKHLYYNMNYCNLIILMQHLIIEQLLLGQDSSITQNFNVIISVLSFWTSLKIQACARCASKNKIQNYQNINN